MKLNPQLGVIFLFFFVCSFSVAQTYTTIGNGPWTDASNWDANGVPPTSITNDIININHRITVNNIFVNNGGVLNVNSILLLVGNLELDHPNAELNINSGVIVTDNGNILNKRGRVNFNYGRFQACNGNYQDESNHSSQGSFGIGTLYTQNGNIENTHPGNYSSQLEWCADGGSGTNMIIPENCSFVNPPGTSCPDETTYLQILCGYGLTDSDGDNISDFCDLDDDNDGIPDNVELGTLINTEQQPCGGDMSLDFSGTQTLLSGTDLQQGAVYRFSDVHSGPDLDAIVTIVETNNATVVELDRNVTTPESFKPRTGFNFTRLGEFGYIEYLIQFVDKGTTNPFTINKFFMNFNDLDGGPNFGEQNWADNPKTYTIDNPTEVTMNTDGSWIVATGATSDYGPSTNEFPYINFAVNYTNKSEIRIRVGAIARVAGVSSTGRSHSIEFNCVTNYVSPETYSLDGDADGLANHLDLDSDNDGILDAVESGHAQSHTNGIISGPYGTNGLADAVETSPGSDTINYTLTDTDTTNGFNYIDVDSDSDGCYDALEGTAGNTYTDIDVITGQLLATVDSNGLPGGTSQGIGTSVDSSVLSDVCINSGAMIDFDGVDDYVESVNSVINNLTEYTISCWFKYDGGPIINNSNEVFVMGQKDLFEITVRNWSNSQPSYEAIGANIYRTNGLKQSSGWRMLPGEWTHVTVTVEHTGGNTNFRVFRNGFASSPGGTVNGTITGNSNPFRIGIVNGTTNYVPFTGAIDEVRVFNKVLSDQQIQRMIYQEIKNEGGNIRGTIIDKDIKDEATNDILAWTDLISYYNMSSVNNGKLPDVSSNGNDAILYNITTFQEETAPMPYETVADGAWTTEATWLHGDIWDIESLDTDFGASNQNPEPWSIVKVHHNVTTNTNRRNLGLFIDPDKTLTTIGNISITNSWYLQLDGTLDLAGDSQLVQTENSDLVTSAAGKILRRQEGNSNAYWYNYWSSPVGTTGATSLTNNNGTTNNTNNTPFNLSMIKDGAGTAMQFTSAFDEAGKISNRWLYTFLNGQDYNDWVALTPASNIASGVGYTQKGTGNAGSEQQYIFEGKPNNGTILVAADDVDGDAATESDDGSRTTTLVGNPYPSALDADEFIRDNIDFDNGEANPVINGTILLWEQWAGTSHWLEEYQGGYGYINLTETERAYQHPDIPIANPANADNRGIKTPTRFIPVGQGFFVEVIADSGDIEFNNGQRVFKQEDLGESVFLREASNNAASEEESAEAEDPMQIIRLEFATSNGATRRFVLGFSDHTTDGMDLGYDGGLITELPEEDMTSLLADKPMVIQALSPITQDKVVDLGLNVSGNHNYSLDIVEVKNIAEDQEIYLRDNLNNTYFDLRQGQPYSFTSQAGAFNDRFDIVFKNDQTLSDDDMALENVIVFNNDDRLFVKGLQQDAKSLTITNMLGQTVKQFNELSVNELENGILLGEISTGIYMVNVITQDNSKLNKKIIVE